MSITVNINPLLYQYTNDQGVVKVNGKTVGECLDQVVKQFPDIKKAIFDKKGKLLSYVDIFVNKESAYPEDLNKPVTDGDELHILFTVAGG